MELKLDNKDLYDFVRRHRGYEAWSDEEISDYLEEMELEGCGFIAAVKALLDGFKNDPQGFETKFGFPLYDKKGNYNYVYAIVDYYLVTNDKIFIEYAEAQDAYVNCKYWYYYNNPEKYRRRYGESLLDDNGADSNNVWNNINDEYITAKAAENEVVNIPVDGASLDYNVNLMDYYCDLHDVSFSYLRYEELQASIIERYIDAGCTVIFSVDKFELQNEDGSVYGAFLWWKPDPIESHAMIITGIEDDGRYNVLTRGEAAYFDPNDNLDEMSIYGYSVYRVNY